MVTDTPKDPIRTLTYSEWREYEARRIVSMGSRISDRENARDWMIAQIMAAIAVAYGHGSRGKAKGDLIR